VRQSALVDEFKHKLPGCSTLSARARGVAREPWRGRRFVVHHDEHRRIGRGDSVDARSLVGHG
jgi:hypothetical protein